MASFLVETFAPQLDAARLGEIVARARAAAETVGGSDGRVRHVRSYVVPGDEMCFHVFEATSDDLVVQVAALAGIEIERIVATIGIEGAGEPDPAYRVAT